MCFIIDKHLFSCIYWFYVEIWGRDAHSWKSEGNFQSFLLLLGVLGLNSSCQAWWQMPLPSEPSFCSCLINVSNNQNLFYFCKHLNNAWDAVYQRWVQDEHPRYKRVKGHPIAGVGRNRTWRGLSLPVDPYWVLHLLFLGTWPRNQVPGILVNRWEREPAVCRFCGKQTCTQHKQIIQHFTQAWMSSDASDLENIRGQPRIVRALTGTTSGHWAQWAARQLSSNRRWY